MDDRMMGGEDGVGVALLTRWWLDEKEGGEQSMCYQGQWYA